MVDHIIMDVPYAYNIIITRSLLNSLIVTLSTYNLQMQYLEVNGFTERIVRDQKSTRERYKPT